MTSVAGKIYENSQMHSHPLPCTYSRDYNGRVDEPILREITTGAYYGLKANVSTFEDNTVAIFLGGY